MPLATAPKWNAVSQRRREAELAAANDDELLFYGRFEEGKHPRGKPKNKGQFSPKGQQSRGANEVKPAKKVAAVSKKPPAASAKKVPSATGKKPAASKKLAVPKSAWNGASKMRKVLEKTMGGKVTEEQVKEAMQRLYKAETQRQEVSASMSVGLEAGDPITKVQLTSAQKKVFERASERVLKSMKPKMVDLFHSRMNGYSFFQDLDSLNKYRMSRATWLQKLFPVEKAAAYVINDGPDGRTNLAFAADMGKSDLSAEDTMTHVMAHEYSHVLDYDVAFNSSGAAGFAKSLLSYIGMPPPLLAHSMKPEWTDAWNTEIKNPKMISDYAGTSAAEGWAEFGRVVFLEPDAAEKKFPKCWAVWKSNGIV